MNIDCSSEHIPWDASVKRHPWAGRIRPCPDGSRRTPGTRTQQCHLRGNGSTRQNRYIKTCKPVSQTLPVSTSEASARTWLRTAQHSLHEPRSKLVPLPQGTCQAPALFFFLNLVSPVSSQDELPISIVRKQAQTDGN